jgi:hypothetical protein
MLLERTLRKHLARSNRLRVLKTESKLLTTAEETFLYLPDLPPGYTFWAVKAQLVAVYPFDPTTYEKFVNTQTAGDIALAKSEGNPWLWLWDGKVIYDGVEVEEAQEWLGLETPEMPEYFKMDGMKDGDGVGWLWCWELEIRPWRRKEKGEESGDEEMWG